MWLDKINIKKIRQPSPRQILSWSEETAYLACKVDERFPLHHCHPSLFLFTPEESYIARNLDAFETNNGPVIFLVTFLKQEN